MPNGSIGTSTTNSITVNYGNSATSGAIKVRGSNVCGVGDSSALAITVNQLPANAGNISGTSSVCKGQGSVSYNTPLISNATSYIWTLPNGVAGTSSTNNITVNYGTSATSGNITVKGINLCGLGDSSSIAIIVNQLPTSAGAISGLSAVCQGQNSLSYTIPSIANATSYIWDLPNGVTGTSSTNNITVNYGTSAISGNIIVKGSNSCGVGDSSTLTITVNPLPSSAGTISGVSTVCQGQNSISYTVPSIANATSYIWNLPNGSTGTSTTNSIIANYGTSAVSGNIKVKGNNSCGQGDSSILALTVNPLPATPNFISGNSIVTKGQQNVVYTVPTVAGANSYIWGLPFGVNGISISNSINVSYSSFAQSGTIKVKAHNNCGDGNYSYLPITVQNNIGSGIGLPYNAISLFPSPATYTATIIYTLKVNQTIDISVYDIMGRKIKELINTHQQSGTHQLTLDATELKEGIYFLKIEGEENFETVKFSVMH